MRGHVLKGVVGEGSGVRRKGEWMFLKLLVRRQRVG